MTNRARFLAAFEGKATDRPPVYEQAFSSDVASAILGREAYTGGVMLHYQEAVAWSKGQEAYEQFLRQVQEDTVDLARTLHFGALASPWMRGAPTKRLGEHEFLYGDPNTHWIIYRYDPEVCTYGPVKYSQKPQWEGEEAFRAEVEAAWKNVEQWEETGKASAVEFLKHWQSLAGEAFEVLGRGGGLSIPLDEKWLTACVLAPDLVGAYLDTQVAMACKQMDAQVPLGIKIIWGGGDLADNHGPLYGPEFFKKVVRPRYQEITEHAHRLGMKYLFRSDGDLWSIADALFAESGMDGYGEIDFDAGMHVPCLQKKFPYLTCWGNVSCDLLRRGTPTQVREAARELIDQVLPLGRLILGSANTILPKTPVENVMAMYEAATDYTVS